MDESTTILGIDVGGSSIKAARVDIARGELVSERVMIDTPSNFTFSAVVDRLSEVARSQPRVSAIGIGFPAAVRGGIVESPPTAHEVSGWVGRDLAQALHEAIGQEVSVANDADCAGMAEVARLTEETRRGVVICLTLGTGVGSSLFVDGTLVPNTELGKLYRAGSTEVAELSVASRVKTEAGLSWDDWAARLNDYLAQVDRLFLPSRVILGGGISAEAGRFLPRLRMRCPVVAAESGNDAGIIGAAVCALSPLSKSRAVLRSS